ncbi:MAG: PorV/PorQ family protein [Candidatus Marinimicrobia bacterium]|nr:PorV/PorQ family protein [Candidatus Neomarinimicrobiota bacterium]MCF7827401.1 PorV/PorQ family protein [Candidatus Neomarinimicrobiota bacterium]MCF7881366.1 PorV/PorQ family protein [Candidatus Neomarinimicrobiota bacterium]
MTFLQVGMSPRATSLGDAYTAVGTGAEAIFYNPAAITEFDGSIQAYVTNTRFIADINHIAGALAFQLGTAGTVGLSMQSVDYGEIIHTSILSESNFQANPQGYIEHGLVENVGAYAFGVTYARQVTNKFSMGGNVRYVGQNLGTAQPTDTTSLEFGKEKFVYDMGVKFNTGFKSFKFGMSMRNFATAVQFQEISNQLPLNFSLGGSMNLMDFVDESIANHSALLSVEFSHPNNYAERTMVGLEYTFMDLFSVRTGYRSNFDIGGFSAGFGISPEISGKRITIDYSYSQTIDYFEPVTRIALSANL